MVKRIWSKQSFGSNEKVLWGKIIVHGKFLVKKNLWSKNICGPRKIWQKKIFGQKKVGKKYLDLWSKNSSAKKTFLVKRNFWSKKSFWSQKFWVKTNFSQTKKFCRQKF